jgi:hypothetical protein
MGGWGSGQRFGTKNNTNDYRALDIRRWQRGGLLTPGSAFNWQWMRNGETVALIHVRTEVDRVILAYRHRRGGGEWQDEEYPVWLNWTACYYGGKRVWFRCPAAGCGRRVAILYGGAIFACRHCYRLAYPCQREPTYDRQARRADKIRNRLNWEPGILNGKGWKPKGMHWRTFERLSEEHDSLVSASMAGILRHLKREG